MTKILIELPTWLGDAVMATPAIENLHRRYPNASITLFGSYVAVEALKAAPFVEEVYLDRTKEGFRLYNLYKSAKAMGRFDLALSFRSHLASSLLLHFCNTPHHFRYKKSGSPRHQVVRYQDFVDHIMQTKLPPGPLRLYWPKKSYAKPTLGINPGATYGSAKRWCPEKFAEVAAALREDFKILIFGGPGEKAIADAIEAALSQIGVEDVQNLAAKTTIPQLCSAIGGLNLFITGDSGPMHIAAAYGVPTVAIFGPTKHEETSQWMNEKSLIVRHDLACAPCMQRTCPLKHHACMKEIETHEVIEAARTLLTNQ